MGALLLVLLFHAVSNALEWSGVTPVLDRFEDYVQILAPALFGFFVYSVMLDEKARRAREMGSQLAEAHEIAGLGRWELDLRTNALTWSEGIYRLFGLDPQQFEASYEAFLSVVHPEDREWVDAAYTQSVETGEPYDIVHRLLLKDGTVRYVREICRTEYDSAGAPLRSVGTVQDVTRVKRQEKEIEESERRFRLLFEDAPIPYQSLDADGRILAVNRKWQEAMGLSRDEAVGRLFPDLLTPASREGFGEKFAAFKSKGRVEGVEFDMECADGTVIRVAFDGQWTETMEAGAPRQHSHCVFKDVTAERLAAERIEHLSRVLRAVRDVNQLIVHEKEIDTLLQSGCELLVSAQPAI